MFQCLLDFSSLIRELTQSRKALREERGNLLNSLSLIVSDSDHFSEIRCYEAEARYWLSTGINSKLDELFECVKGESGDYLISETLRMLFFYRSIIELLLYCIFFFCSSFLA
jgi:hypothetical protein